MNSSYNFQWIILKPCIFVMGILKMCTWVFDGARFNLTELLPFELSHFRQLSNLVIFRQCFAL